MASSSSPPSWIILSKVVRVSANQHNDVSIDDAALPPGLSHLTVSASIFPSYPNPQEAAARIRPRILAADLSNGLLLTTTRPDTLRVLVLDVFASPMKAYCVPALGRDLLDRAGLDHANPLGVICAPRPNGGGIFMVVGFHYQVQQPGSPTKGRAWLHYYSHDSLRGDSRQFTKAVNNPMPRRHWDFSDVIAHDGRLWWVDTAEGLLFCDPFADCPVMEFIPAPDILRVGDDDDDDLRRGFCCQCSGIRLAARRRVQVVHGKLRWVQMRCRHMDLSRRGAPTVLGFTLELGDDPMADDDDSETETTWDIADWYSMSFADIWASNSYKRTRLPQKEPVLACIHPYNPAVVYFVLDRLLFGVHMLNKELVTNLQLVPGADDVSAASSLLAYDVSAPVD